MRIEFTNFKGAQPKVAATLLEPSRAQVANNCNITRGDIRGLRAPDKEEALTATTVNSLYLYEENSNQNWVTETTDYNYVKSPIADDAYERVYYTGATEPRFFANDNVSTPFSSATDYYKLGIPAPTAAPTVGAGTGAAYRAYEYSYVNSYGDEGPPSAIGSIATFDTGDTIAISALPGSAPAGRAINKIYLYRSNSSDLGTAEFQYALEATWFSASVDYAVGDFVIYSNALYQCTTIHNAAAWNAGNFTAGDDVSDDDLLSVFPKIHYDPPPTGLTAIVSLPNGTIAGISGKALYLSEPFHPHAFPTDYIIGFDDTPVGLGVVGTSIIVITDGYPYEVYGPHPAEMAKRKIQQRLPCTNKRSIAMGRDRVLWAAPEGLAEASIDGVGIVTENVVDEETWDGFVANGIEGYFYLGRYYGFLPVVTGGFIVDFVNNEYYTTSETIHAGFVDDYFYVVVDDVSIVDENDLPVNMPLCVSVWDKAASNFLQFTWRSKALQLPESTNMAAGYVVADQSFYDDIIADMDLATINAAAFAAGLTSSLGLTPTLGGGLTLGGDGLVDLVATSISNAITFKLFADGEQRAVKTVSGEWNKFRLPGGYLSDEIEIEISGYIPVRRVVVATSMDEI